MKTAVLGVWHVHSKYHVRTAMKYGEVIGFYEKNDALAADFLRDFDLPRFKSREELLAAGSEGVIVCSATCDHRDDLVAAANAKKKIFCEKLLAPTSWECDEIIRAVERNGVELTLEFEQKYIANRMAVVAAAKRGEFGKINFVRFRYSHSGSNDDMIPAHFYNRAETGGGVIADHGAHGFYMIHEILGMPETAVSLGSVACSNPSALAKNRDRVEDNAATVMRFADGAIAVNECSSVCTGAPSAFEVYGERGFVCTFNDGIKKCSDLTGNEIVELECTRSLPLPLVQFMTGERYPGCSVYDGAALTRMIEAAYGGMR